MQIYTLCTLYILYKVEESEFYDYMELLRLQKISSLMSASNEKHPALIQFNPEKDDDNINLSG